MKIEYPDTFGGEILRVELGQYELARLRRALGDLEDGETTNIGIQWFGYRDGPLIQFLLGEEGE